METLATAESGASVFMLRIKANPPKMGIIIIMMFRRLRVCISASSVAVAFSCARHASCDAAGPNAATVQ
jgi:hypothetical protein